MQENEKASTAAEILSRSRRVVVGKQSGYRYLVRRLSEFEAVGVLGRIPDLQAFAERALRVSQQPSAEDAAAVAEHSASIIAVFERVVKAALLEPKLGDGGLLISDIPVADLADIFTSVMEMTGYSEKAAEEIRPT